MNKLIICDCDGVLVDSEILAHRGDIELLRSMGYSISIEESIRRFTGINTKDFRKIILAEVDISISDDFFEQRKRELIKSFELHLKPLIEPVLIKLTTEKIKKCVASSSSKERVIKSLQLTDQFKFFSESSIFVSDQVQRGKPKPDLFIFAAKQMGCAPENCIVIEDSVPGIKAAMAAKMNVIGFLGGEHAQYNWYRQHIEGYKIPIANNNEELWQWLKVFLND
ncbi:HAD family hydrolase [Legionella gresilensis]|uniref:HAD family hydrolase n=1 Tax=Legionella gresilensis TaxID=91823 RepID=UPI0010417221|nr:HAD family phosphatase [Legionella gresilensis]